MSSTNASIASFNRANAAYRAARPTYPDALFAWLADHAPTTERALDCATGSGQAARSLARHFGRVDAFDRFRSQIEAAHQADNIHYCVSEAEATPYDDNSFDLITAAQAIHWFDRDRYWPEMGRVAKTDALFCAMGYNRFLGAEDIDGLLIDPILDLIDPLWAPNNKLVWEGYDPTALRFPLQPLAMDRFPLKIEWTLRHYIDFVESWSATRKARQNKAMSDTLDSLIQAVLEQEGAERILSLHSDLFVMAGRFP